jgi:membrane-bound lytic murein transglycosylase B
MTAMPRIALSILMLLLTAMPAPAASDAGFTAFLKAFEAKAVAAGIDRAVYRDATDGLTPDPDIPDLVATQPEFTTPIWDYLDQRVSAGRIARGQAAFAANRALFQSVGRRTGVDPYLLAAIWGIETEYGAVLGNHRLIRPVIRSLATLSYEKRGRVDQDEADFIAALKIIQANHLRPDQLVGSWAGAIGHLQVSPQSVVAHGRDGDGDGRIDLNGSLSDALMTSATFLLDLGYAPGVDWGFEVVVPNGFDYLLADRTQPRPISFFAARGVKRVGGRDFADTATPVFLYAPAGSKGPKFLMTGNYAVLKGYNFSDSYALAVAHLTDRLKGSKDFAAAWPRQTKFPNLAQRMAIQRALVRLGYYQGEVDGRIGPVTQAAYARFQAARGEVADGFITIGSFEELNAAR